MLFSHRYAVMTIALIEIPRAGDVRLLVGAALAEHVIHALAVERAGRDQQVDQAPRVCRNREQPPARALQLD